MELPRAQYSQEFREQSVKETLIYSITSNRHAEV